MSLSRTQNSSNRSVIAFGERTLSAAIHSASAAAISVIKIKAGVPYLLVSILLNVPTESGRCIEPIRCENTRRSISAVGVPLVAQSCFEAATQKATLSI